MFFSQGYDMQGGKRLACRNPVTRFMFLSGADSYFYYGIQHPVSRYYSRNFARENHILSGSVSKRAACDRSVHFMHLWADCLSQAYQKVRPDGRPGGAALKPSRGGASVPTHSRCRSVEGSKMVKPYGSPAFAMRIQVTARLFSCLGLPN